MSLHSYHYSKTLSGYDPPFSALLFAAKRKADTENTHRLKTMWPELYEEFDRRYNAPGGILPEDNVPEGAVLPEVPL